jgi:hypothetical protein
MDGLHSNSPVGLPCLVGNLKMRLRRLTDILYLSKGTISMFITKYGGSCVSNGVATTSLVLVRASESLC